MTNTWGQLHCLKRHCALLTYKYITHHTGVTTYVHARVLWVRQTFLPDPTRGYTRYPSLTNE